MTDKLRFWTICATRLAGIEAEGLMKRERLIDRGAGRACDGGGAADAEPVRQQLSGAGR